jgi:hypothetical protein
MCLFNVELLRAKVADAKMVLDSSDDEGAEAEAIQPVPITPQAKKIAVPTAKATIASPQTPDLSSRGPSATASPAPVTPGNSTQHTIASLARLPAAEIIRLATSANATGLPLPKADPLVVQATDEFIDGLLDKPPQVQKQQLGDKLFKTVKSFGIKAAVRLFSVPTFSSVNAHALTAESHDRPPRSGGSARTRASNEQLPHCAQRQGTSSHPRQINRLERQIVAVIQREMT